jgi:hypothetical protein
VHPDSRKGTSGKYQEWLKVWSWKLQGKLRGDVYHRGKEGVNAVS